MVWEVDSQTEIPEFAVCHCWQLCVWLVLTSYQGVCCKSRFCLHFLHVSENKKITRTHYHLHKSKKLWELWISKLSLLYKYILFLCYYFCSHYYVLWSRDWRTVLGFWSPKLYLMPLVSVGRSPENAQAMNATQSCCQERETHKEAITLKIPLLIGSLQNFKQNL